MNRNKDANLFVNAIETAFPEKKMKVSDDPHLNAEEKILLQEMGYSEYYLGSPEFDCIVLMVQSGKKVMKTTANPPRIDLFLTSFMGNNRAYGDWPVVAYLQQEIGVRECHGMMLYSTCASFTSALSVFSSLTITHPDLETALIDVGVSGYAPLISKAAYADVQRQRGLIFGAGAASVIVSKKPGPIEILECTLGTSFIDEWSWRLPAQTTPFEVSNGTVIGGGYNHLSWEIGGDSEGKAETQGTPKVYPAQRVVQEILTGIAKAVRKHNIKELNLSCLPLGKTEIHKSLAQLSGISIINRSETISNYAHVGSADPLMAMDYYLRSGEKGDFCHICLGQGYTGSFVLYRIRD